jgi:Undecaprenyl-phosphate galactose phosphotransferase WbaP
MVSLRLKELTSVLNSNEIDPNIESKIPRGFKRAIFVLLFSDFFAITTSIIISVFVKAHILNENPNYYLYLSILPYVLPAFVFAFAIRGLYPGYGIDSIDELRETTYTTSIMFGIIASITFIFKGGSEYSRYIFIISWFFSMVTIFTFRSFVRNFFSKKAWWGLPFMIIGAGITGVNVIMLLKRHIHTGFKPILAVDDNIDKWGYIKEVPVVGGLNLIPELISKLKIENAIFAIPNVNTKIQKEIFNKYSNLFKRSIVIPELFYTSDYWASPHDLGGILSFELQKNLLKRSSAFIKRISDLVLVSFLMIFALPLILVISLCILIDSKGNIFFYQERVGRFNIPFKIIKFRTMHINAEQKLQELLDSDEDIKKEFSINHKLKNDPRITKVGKFIRKYNLDELPQFFNVLNGEMSLIGPRACLDWEHKKINGRETISKVKPGITGFWQVTLRNDVDSDFSHRSFCDLYYIHNWSVLLDVYIIFKTFGVILTGKGV